MLLRTLLFFGVVLIVGCANNPGLFSEMASGAEGSERLGYKLKTLYEDGEALYKSGQLEEARVKFLAMLVLEANEPNANYRLGTIAFKQGKYDLSAGYFDAVIQADPKNQKAHFNLASIRLMQAENHFKYYAALIDSDVDLSKVSQLIADIDKFNSRRKYSRQEISLEQLAASLKK